MIITTAVAALRQSSRLYMRMPWAFGKLRVAGLYYQYANWRPHQQVVKTRFGARMDVAMPDSIATAIYLTGQWEPCLTQYIRKHLSPGDTFVDVGANVGYYSLLASTVVGPSGHVVAIEASTAIYGKLRRNIELNRCQNVRALNVAASDGPGTLPVFMAGADNIGHTTTVTSLAEREGLTQENSIRADSLENLVGAQALRNARFIKVDVEGAEISVLSPLFSALKEFSVDTEWLLEFSPEFSAGGQDDLNRIFDAFRKSGYRAYKIPNEYNSRFQIFPPPCSLTQLHEAPTSLTDVLMTRRSVHNN